MSRGSVCLLLDVQTDGSDQQNTLMVLDGVVSRETSAVVEGAVKQVMHRHEVNARTSGSQLPHSRH